jgi:hypothetical protein
MKDLTTAPLTLPSSPDIPPALFPNMEMEVMLSYQIAEKKGNAHVENQ